MRTGNIPGHRKGGLRSDVTPLEEGPGAEVVGPWPPFTIFLLFGAQGWTSPMALQGRVIVCEKWWVTTAGHWCTA